MAMITASSPFPANAPPPSFKCFLAPMQPTTATSESSRSRRTLLSHFVIKNNKFSLDIVEDDVADWQEVGKANANDETLLYSFSPLPLSLLAALLGAGTMASLFEPFIKLVKSFSLLGWLVHWGHPGRMAVVLFAMGGYGTYLGYQIHFLDDAKEKANAKDLHPKLLAGMFFSLLLEQLEGYLERLIGLSLLTIQTILPALFEGKPELRTVHGVFGTGIMTLFVVHAALGLQLGLSY
ncbi:hypothetical protein C1H46_001157 [Malus baccata]|uniref:Uncharacterized protein n=1 Tax=Malus baccata TaxID=106549 RepID=A0A540NR35_MALBA|nr:hypothetical protein C1H46_001157 [Malus baccata]